MRGDVLSYDDAVGTGLISGDDGERYTFARSDLQQLAPLRAGMKVDFVPAASAATQIFLISTPQTTGYTPGVAGSGSVFDWRTLFLDANGRIGQKDYWIGIAACIAANFTLGWLPLIGLVVTIATTYVGVCVSSKRLHDMGRSGWLAAIPFGVWCLVTVLSLASFVGGIVGAAMHDNAFGFMTGLGGFFGLLSLAFLINIGFLLWLGLTPSQPDDNMFGPPPQPLANF